MISKVTYVSLKWIKNSTCYITLKGCDVTTFLGFKSRNKSDAANQVAPNEDVAKLFFDSFSGRVSEVEAGLQSMSSEFESLKVSLERSQISDLVLLERLQKTEALIRQSLYSIRVMLEKATEVKAESGPELEVQAGQLAPTEPGRSDVVSEARIASHILSPTGEFGSLPSITTPTELQVLTLLAREGPKSSPEIGRAVGRSREHTARLMKTLYEEGYVRRDQSRIPFRYSVVDRLKQTVVKGETKDEGQETVSAPQS